MANQAIALGVRPPQPIDVGGSAVRYANLMNQMAQMQAAKRAQGQQDYIAQTAPGLDLNNAQQVQSFLAQGGPGAAQLIQNALGAQKLQGDLQSKRNENTDHGLKMVGSIFHSIVKDPSDANLAAASSRLEQMGVEPAMIQSELGAVMHLPVEQRGQAMLARIMEDKDSREAFKATMPDPQQANLGSQIAYIDKNPLSPTYNQKVSTFDVQMTEAQRRAADLADRNANRADSEMVNVSTPDGIVRMPKYAIGNGGVSGNVGADGGRRMGWSPVSDNGAASVNNKIDLISKKAGVGPTAPLSRSQFLALDMTQLEGRPAGANNFGNMRNTDGSFKSFKSREEYNAAQRAWLGRRYDEGARTIEDAVKGHLGKGGAAPAANITPASGQVIPGTKKPAASDLSPETKKARDEAVQDVFNAIEAAHKKGHLVSNDQSYIANRAQEVLQGRTWLPGGTSKKTSIDDIKSAAAQLLRLFIQKGTSGTLNTKAEQDMFLRTVGGDDATYETRMKTIRNFARQNGIKLNDPSASKSKTNGSSNGWGAAKVVGD